VGDCFEHDNEISGSIKGREFIGQVSDLSGEGKVVPVLN
jgi:hypothetical protein